MKIYLVLAAADVTGRHGYGKAVLDAGHDRTLVTFADQVYERRRRIFPEDEDPVWDLQYSPPPIIKRRQVPQ